MTGRSGRLCRALLALCLVPAACGDGGPASGGAPTPPAPASGSPTTSPAPSPSPTSETLSERSLARMDGIGPVRVGMTPAEASAAAGVTLEVLGEPGLGAGSDDCHYVAPGRKPGEATALAFMVVGGRIVRLDVEGGAYATETGVRVGDTEQKVLDGHGAANVSSGPHVYTEGGKYLTVTPTYPALSNHRLIY